tara:strand:+ start:1744 stop:2112 length:369 start_codon:yes stop_codon:yes gene_type:complete
MAQTKIDPEILLERKIADEAGYNTVQNLVDKESHLDNKKEKIIEKMENIVLEKKEKVSYLNIIVIILVLIWFLLGILGWFYSIYCFKYNKNKLENVMGLLISSLLGPFYWLYYFYINNYCGK